MNTTDNNREASEEVIMMNPCCQTEEEWKVTIVSKKVTNDREIVQEIRNLMEALVLEQAKKAKEEK